MEEWMGSPRRDQGLECVELLGGRSSDSRGREINRMGGGREGKSGGREKRRINPDYIMIRAHKPSV